MKMHDLKPRTGATRRRKRVGRGISAGQGKTAGRGTKGEGARSGSGGKLYRQGGNLPFFRRLPFKRGFTNFTRVEYDEVNLDQLEGLPANSTVSPEILARAGLLASGGRLPVVLLGRGEVAVPLRIQVHRATRGARAKVEAAGGTIELLPAAG
jgi:large subunit ribosomal protein L15